MSWLWPGFLLLLGALPPIIAAYVWVLRRRRRYAVRYSSLALVRAALPHQSRWRRHLPFALFVLALASLLIALARPVALVSAPASEPAVILALDVSRSMLQTDIRPSRLEAAQDAALSFIQRQGASTRIGLVGFARFAEMIVPPTTDQEALEAAVASLTTGRGTAIGNGILRSLDVIAEFDPNVAPSVTDPSSEDAPPVPKGAYAPAIIVVLTDGVSTTGPLATDAAQQAADRGVRVYTIGFGTENGSESFGGGRFRRGIDEDTLKRIADLTGGAYYSAESADELHKVFQDLPTYLITRTEIREISVAFTALGAALAALAVALSLAWHALP
jgi:Ca-activated chloride channel family protein